MIGGAVLLELLERNFLHLDRLARLDELDAVDDHLLPGLEPRLEHSQALVVVDRVHLHAHHLARRVDNKDVRPFLPLQDSLLGNDHGVDILANGQIGLDVLARQDRAVGIGNLGPHQKRAGLRVDLVVDEDRLADVGMRAIALDKHVDVDAPRLLECGRNGKIASGRQQIQPHRIKLLKVNKFRGPRVADQVAQLDLQFADPPVDRREHLAVAQIDLRIFDGGFRPGDFRLGVGDVDPVIGLRLGQAGLIGVDLGGALLALGFGLVEIVARRGIARQQVSLATLLDLVERQLCRIESQSGLRNWHIFRRSRPLE